MKIYTLGVGGLKTNCHIIANSEKRKENRAAIIIDPGDDADYIIHKIKDLEVTPKAILATHAHFDHIMAVNELKNAFNIPFYLAKKDEQMLRWYRKSAIYFAHFDPGPPPRVDNYLQGPSPKVQGFDIEVMETPGHTPGGVCLYARQDNTLFSGDTIFAHGAIGRYDFPYCNKKQLLSSVNKLMRLPEKTIVYPGHGEKTTIGEFKKDYFSSNTTTTDL